MNFLNLERFAGKAAFFSVVFLLFFAAAAMAQVPQQQQQPVNTDFSEEELEEFVEVYLQASEIQQENEAAMMQAIEEEDLDVQRFNEILTAQQNQQTAEDINATAEEMAAFNQAAEKIITVQQEAQAKINELIEEEIGGEKYQQIAMAYQQSPEVQERINAMLQKKTQ